MTPSPAEAMPHPEGLLRFMLVTNVSTLTYNMMLSPAEARDAVQHYGRVVHDGRRLVEAVRDQTMWNLFRHEAAERLLTGPQAYQALSLGLLLFCAYKHPGRGDVPRQVAEMVAKHLTAAKAREAAEEVAAFDKDLADVKSDLRLLKWMVGANVGLTLLVLGWLVAA